MGAAATIGHSQGDALGRTAYTNYVAIDNAVTNAGTRFDAIMQPVLQAHEVERERAAADGFFGNVYIDWAKAQVITARNASGTTPIDNVPTRTDGSTESADVHIDPVNPANGEFYLERTDMAFPGKGVPFAFSRVYRSRIAYRGPLGHGWDHSLNQKIVSTGSLTCSDEVLYHMGLGRTNRYRKTSETATDVYYAPAEPARIDLHGYKSAAGLTWVATYADGSRAIFDARGLLVRLEDATRHGEALTWEAYRVDSEHPADQYRLATVTDQAGRVITFEYPSIHDRFDVAGRIDGFHESSSGLRVHYEYDLRGDLRSFVDAQGRRESYDYEQRTFPEQEHLVPEPVAQRGCEQVCAPQSASCDAGDACSNIAREELYACWGRISTCPSDCTQRCNETMVAGAFNRYPRSGRWQDEGLDPRFLQLRQDILGYGNAGCTTNCQAYCPSQGAQDSRKEACRLIGQYAFSTCEARCSIFGGADYSSCSGACKGGFLAACVENLDHLCQWQCEQQCVVNSAKAGCATDCNARNCGTDHIVSECGQKDFLGDCQETCADRCLVNTRGGESAPRVWGQLKDLEHNLVTVKDGDGRVYLTNTYGEDVHSQSFDSIVTQQTGDMHWNMSYLDLPAPTTSNAAAVDDVCPEACIDPPFFNDANLYVPWKAMLVVLKDFGQTAGLPIAQPPPVSIDLTVLFSAGIQQLPPPAAAATTGPSSGTASAQAVPLPDPPTTPAPTPTPTPPPPVGTVATLVLNSAVPEAYPSTFSFKVNTSAGVVAFRRSSVTGQLLGNGPLAALQQLHALGAITMLTDQAEHFRIYRGAPRGLEYIAAGTCTVPFTAVRNSVGQLNVTPASACTGQLEVAPLASVLQQDFAPDSRDIGLNLHLPTELVPARHTFALTQTPTSGLYDQTIGPRYGRSPGSQGLAGLIVRNATPLFRVGPPGAMANRPKYVFHVPYEQRPTDWSDPAGLLYDQFAHWCTLPL